MAISSGVRGPEVYFVNWEEEVIPFITDLKYGYLGSTTRPDTSQRTKVITVAPLSNLKRSKNFTLQRMGLHHFVCSTTAHHHSNNEIWLNHALEYKHQWLEIFHDPAVFAPVDDSRRGRQIQCLLSVNDPRSHPHGVYKVQSSSNPAGQLLFSKRDWEEAGCRLNWKQSGTECHSRY